MKVCPISDWPLLGNEAIIPITCRASFRHSLFKGQPDKLYVLCKNESVLRDVAGKAHRCFLLG